MKHPAPIRPPAAPPSMLCRKENSIQMDSIQTLPKLRLNGGVVVRASATGRILFGMALVFFLFAIIVMRRIWTLEVKNDLMQAQLNEYHDTLKEVLVRLPQLVPETQNQVPLDSIEENSAEEEGSDEVVRTKRELTPNVTGSLRNESLEVEMTNSDDWLLNPKNRSGRKSKDRDKGKCREGRVKALQKRKDSIRKLKLKLKLAKTPHHHPASSSTATFSDPRAIYMIPVTPNVNIKKAEQLIGPWYIGEGRDFGFNDLWYRDVSLDDNKTSIIFKKNGLHLIYAQVYYHLTIGIGERPAPMGYRIYIKKNNTDGRSVFRRPIPIAECVPSYPSTFYQTCFTQAAWYMEVGDQVYLEHFANSFPMIEADRQGKTFLGIVRLSSAQ